MKALTFHAHGGPEVLRFEDVPTPEPGPGEARVRVKAVALNHLDLFVRKGWPGLKLEMPHIGGSDIAGVVDKLGEGAHGPAPGTRVVIYPDLSCGRCEWCTAGQNVLCPEHRLIGEHTRGGLAEFVVVPAANLKVLPDAVTFEAGAATALVYVTAWRMLIPRARLRAGETVLVVGAGGGVNSAAIQIAKLAGARKVYALAGGPEKAKAALALGADEVVDYKAHPEWAREISRLTRKRGVDVVVDNVGAATWEQSLRAATRGGRIVTVGGTTGYAPPAMLNLVFWKQLEIIGSTMGTRAEFDTVLDLVFQGRLKPVLDRVMPLSKGVEAQEALARGEAMGKIVLLP